MRSRLLDPDGLHRSNRIRAALTAIIGLVCLAAIIASLAAFTHSSSRFKVDPAALVSVPDLVDSTAAHARRVLTDLDLVVSTRTVSDPFAPAGHVLRTEPPVDTKVRRGTKITLVVSGGPVMTTVPNVAGLAEDAAVRSLLAAHLQIGTSFTGYSRFRRGLLARTSPSAGARVAAGTTVDITIANGLTTVPDVTNQPSANATALVQAAGLGVVVLQQAIAAAAPGTIAQITPMPGSVLPVGTTITLTAALALPPPAPSASVALADSPTSNPAVEGAHTSPIREIS